MYKKIINIDNYSGMDYETTQQSQYTYTDVYKKINLLSTVLRRPYNYVHTFYATFDLIHLDVPNNSEQL